MCEILRGLTPPRSAGGLIISAADYTVIAAVPPLPAQAPCDRARGHQTIRTIRERNAQEHRRLSVQIIAYGITLFALWNQTAGEGPGGTADMVKLAKSHGAKVREQNSDLLFGIVS